MPSHAVKDIVYDAAARTLSVTFVASGRRYLYRDVPFETYDAFRHAFSKGHFFNRHIRDRYPHDLLFDPAAPAGSPSPAPLLRP